MRSSGLSNKTTSLLPYVVAAAVVLALLGLNRGFWEDEAWLALAISNSSATGLFKELADGQVAPIGFLLLERLATTLFGNHDWAYRVVPAIASLLIIDQIRRFPVSAFRRVLFLALLFLNPVVLRYTVEAKQYILDVLVAVALLRFLLSERPMRVFAVLAIGVWFSNIVFIAALPTTIVLALRKPRITRGEMLQIASCAVSLGLYYALFVHGHGNREYMTAYWTRTGGLFDGGSIVWFVRRAIKIVAQGFAPVYDLFFQLGMARLGVVSFAILVLASQFDDIGRLLALCIVTHLSFAVIGLYPVAERLMLYMVPLTLWLLVRLNLKPVAWGALLALTGLSFMRRPTFPFATDDTRRYMASLHSAGVDTVYTVGGVTAIARFYSQSRGYGMEVIRVRTENEIINPQLPLLIVSHEYQDFDSAFLERYHRIDEMRSPLGISQASLSGLFMPVPSPSE